MKKETTMSKNDSEKAKALDAALAQIERSFGKGSVMKLSADHNPMEVESISTGSLGLDIGLGIGGVPRGRIIEVYGPESSGKTTLALHIIAEAQKTGGTCAIVDAEHARLTLRFQIFTCSSHYAQCFIFPSFMVPLLVVLLC